MSIVNDIREAFSATDQPVGDITASQVFNILRNDRRRTTIKLLANYDTDTIQVSTLAEQIAAAEHGPNYTAANRKAAYTSLVQTHLDHLDDTNIASSTRRTIQVGPNASWFANIIDHVTEEVHA